MTPDEQMEHIEAFIRDFARSGWGQQTLDEIEMFGLPGVDSAADLTDLQSLFIQIAKNEREHKKNQRMPST